MHFLERKVAIDHAHLVLESFEQQLEPRGGGLAVGTLEVAVFHDRDLRVRRTEHVVDRLDGDVQFESVMLGHATSSKSGTRRIMGRPASGRPASPVVRFHPTITELRLELRRLQPAPSRARCNRSCIEFGRSIRSMTDRSSIALNTAGLLQHVLDRVKTGLRALFILVG